jgi:amino acid adenylation domain-containing protein/thioester reductase-like protein/non-ribosomal peptide synthase protein (TIGR01720 family)
MDLSSKRAGLSPAKRALLERYLKGNISPSASVRTIPPAGSRQVPLSFTQQRIWLLCQMEPASPFYHMAYRVHFSGALHVAALEQVLDEIVRRHEILRTVYRLSGGSPIQEVLPAGHVHLPYVDMSHLSATVREEELARLCDEEVRRPFDLTVDLPIRVRLIALGQDAHDLLLTVHHIAFDGWSLGVLIREVERLYPTFTQGMSQTLPPLAIQYKDLASWQRQALEGEEFQRHLDFWLGKLDRCPVLQLPADYPRPAKQSFRGANFPFVLTPELSRGLKGLSLKEGVTLFSLCLAAFQLLLQRYSGQSDIVLGTVVANRDIPEASNLIGCLLNTLALRSYVDAGACFNTFLQTVHRNFLDVYEHRELPFEKLVEELHPDRDPSRNPVFQIAMVFHNAPIGELTLPGLSITAAEVDLGISRFDLTLHLAEAEGKLSGWFEYSTDLFREATVARIASHWQTLLEGIVADPQARLSELPMLTASEYRQLAAWNATDAPRAPDCQLHHWFEIQAARTPEAMAIVHGEQTLCYGALDQRANRLAHALRQHGIGPEVRVGVCLEPGADLVVALLAILKASGAYVPIDPTYPAQRQRDILADSGAVLAVTRSTCATALSAGDTTLFYLDRQRLDDQPCHAPDVKHHPENAAYLIYTSGSTGRPKGVVVSHRNAVHSTAARFAYYPKPVQSFLLLSSYAFDSSVAGIFWTLGQGGRLCLPSEADRRDPSVLARLIAKERVSHLLCLPSLYDLLLKQAESGQLASLDTVIVAGEVCSAQIAADHFSKMPAVNLYNEYGPTEASVWSSVHAVQPTDARSEKPVPIGRPIANTRIHLLDAHGNPVPVGVTGELYIGGLGVARGYHGQPALIAERFVPDPFSNTAGGRLYRTGDLARYRSDGAIEFLGRIDHQVKIRGYRIELGEIEARLLAHPGVKEAAVLAWEDHPGDKRLVAYLVLRDGIEDREHLQESVRDDLRAALPVYMVPSAFVFMESFPLSPNGKLDRGALPAPDAQLQLVRQYVAPRNRTEEILAAIWAEVLKVERVGIYDNFFELGGHSLLAVTLIERLRREGQSLDVQALFTAPTIAEAAAAIGRTYTVDVPPNRIPLHCDAIAPEMLTLVTLSQSEIDRIVNQVPGGVANVQDIYPLAPLQEGILFHHLMGAQGDIYLLSALLAFDTRERLENFLNALQAVIDRHDILRTAVLWEALPEPVQVVWRKAPFIVEEVTLDPDAESAAEWLQARFDPGCFRLDLRQAPLLRGYMVHDVRRRQWLLLLLIHHLVLDHTTLKILIEEVRAHMQNEVHCLPAPQPFRNFVAQARLGVSTEEHEAFFRKMLGDIAEPTVAFGLRDVLENGGGIEEATVDLDINLARRLRACARTLGVTAASLCHLAFAQVLARTSGRDDVVFGTVLFGRLQGSVGADQVPGLFINTLPMRIRLGREGVADSVYRTHAGLAELVRHEHAPLAVAQRCSGVPAPTPLFSVLFNYRYSPETVDMGPDRTANSVWEGVALLTSVERTNYPVTLSVDNLGEGFRLTAQVQSPIRPQRLCTYMETALANLTTALERAPAMPMRDIEVLPEAERDELLIQWNATYVEYPPYRTVLEFFAEQVARVPGAIAVAAAGRALTYAQVDARSSRLASFLRQRGIGPETRVGICIERMPDLVLGLLGILKAGGAYVPMDTDNPIERTIDILADSGATLVLTQASSAARLANCGADLICLDRDWPEIEKVPFIDFPRNLYPDNAAYVIYTSGSTGKPKGVVVSHGNLLHSTLARCAFYPQPVEGFLLISPAAFDSSVAGIFWTLCQGGKLCIPSEEERRDPHALAELVFSHSLTHLLCLPSLYDQIVDQAASGRLASLRTAIVAGEACATALATKHKESLPDTALYNEYGPTEGTVWSTVHHVQPTNGDAPVPIGRPICNVRTYVLDTAGRPVPAGVPGELYIAGLGLARGYLNRPDLTAERFVPNPFAAGERLYRTGDRVRYRYDGSIEFLGRIDQQIKIRGFRVELGEIEAQICQYPAVRDAAVVARQDIGGFTRIVGYLVAKDKTDLDQEKLREFLGRVLPTYMIPSVFVVLDCLPLTANGKLDRKQLPEPERAVPSEQRYVPPRTSVEKILARIWSEVLKVDRIGLEDRFFALGGDSILAIQVIGRARQNGITITPRQLLECETIANLACIADQTKNSLEDQEPVTGEVPLTPIQSWFFEQNNSNPNHWNQCILLDVRGELDLAHLVQALKQLVEHHDVLRLRFMRSGRGWRQCHSDGENQWAFHHEDLSALPASDLSRSVETLGKEWQGRLDISHGPIMRAVLFDFGRQRGARLLLIIHHLVVDGVSWRILVEDFEAVYHQLCSNGAIELPAKTTSFKSWSRHLYEYAKTEMLRQDAEYWLSLPWESIAPLPVDNSAGANLIKTVETICTTLSSEETERLLRVVPKTFGERINDLLLTALAQALKIWCGNDRFSIELEGHGREEDLFEGVDLSRTVGWFTSSFPLVLDLSCADTLAEALTAVSRQLRHIPKKGLPYGVARFIRCLDGFADFPKAQVAFNYLGQIDRTPLGSSLFSLAPESIEGVYDENFSRAVELEISAQVLDGKLEITWTYSGARFRRSTVQTLANAYTRVLTALIRVCSMDKLPQPEVRLPPAPEASRPSVATQPDWDAEMTLDPAIMPAANAGAAPIVREACLVTGATGFVGVFLLDELLRKTTAKVYCLVRAATPTEAFAKIQSQWIKYRLIPPAATDRIIPLCGDLAEPLLGLASSDFKALANEIDTIYHVGAATNLVQPYFALKHANVSGTREVLRLACTGRVKAVHYTSTLSVFSHHRVRSGKEITEDDIPVPDSTLTMGYAQTKLVAEQLVRSAGMRGCPVVIYRLGTVTGHCRTGAWNTDDFYCRLLNTCVEMGEVPEPDDLIDMTPVDYVGTAIVHLSGKAKSLGRTFHLQNPNPIGIDRFLTLMAEIGRPLKLINYSDWVNKILKIVCENPDHRLHPFIPYFEEYKDNQFKESTDVNHKTDCRKTVEALESSGILCPAISENLLQCYLEYQKACGSIDESAC